MSIVAYLLFGFGIFYFLQNRPEAKSEPRNVAYSELVELIDRGLISDVRINERTIEATIAPADGKAEERPDRITVIRLPNMDESHLVERLRSHQVKFSAELAKTPWWANQVVGLLLPFAVLFLVYVFVARRMGKSAGPLSFGKSRAKIFDLSQKHPVTFDDVAGVDEAKAELVEIVTFLKSPERYRAVGARPPKGVLIVGAPGTGKTLLARAVAGEAKVPFFSISGSEFVEMFVGVGAARVRDLFEQAKLRAPCIVFIDELDAIGKSRAGVGAAMMTHDEREQTLNQLLVEMDGFDPGGGVVILAATNRPEVLDQALLRAGRFDRQVMLDRPDLLGRKAILDVHVRKVKLGPDVDLAMVARRTPGMAGADIANLVNEAALAAARRNNRVLETRDFEEAVDRLQLGLKKQGRVMTAEERRRVAVHEAGHAVVALSVKHTDPVHRVTIIPRGMGALGATLQLPDQERYLVTREELEDRICVMLAGRAAEEVLCEEVSTGAQNDIERATETARQMVTRFGMSEKLGAVTYAPPGLRFLDAPTFLGEGKSHSEATAQAIDSEVRRIVEHGRTRALDILRQRRAAVERVADRLLADETMERETLEAIVGSANGPAPGGALIPARPGKSDG